MKISVTPAIQLLAGFPVANEQEILRKYNLRSLIRMNSNENCYGPSAAAIKIAADVLSRSHRYAPAYCAQLKDALAAHLQSQPSRIVTGNGSSELVEIIARTFLQPGEKCITALETFPIYHMVITSVNAECATVPLLNGRYDLDGILHAIDSRTRLVFIANPNNPTGTSLPPSDVEAFLREVPRNVVVVLDEAYREYSQSPPDSITLLAEQDNLIVLRTFSKVYGLAGLRIGYGLCSEDLAVHLQKATMPYSVNTIGQAVAQAALQDQDHVRRCVQLNQQQRDLVQKSLSDLGYRSHPSDANFVYLQVQDPASFCEQLLKNGILVTPLKHFQIPNGVRITLGTAEENQLLLRALTS